MFIECKAQTPIIDIYDTQQVRGSIENAYYKDISNFRNQYVGQWLYTNGSTTLKLVFAEKNQIYTENAPKNFYEDYLVGEYQYIENGVEKINTLNNLSINYGNDVYQHNLLSISCIWFPSTYPKCLECSSNERRLRMFLEEPALRDISLGNSFILRAFSENGIQKLKVWFINGSGNGVILDENGNPSNITRFTLPFGEYTLIKQP